MNRKTKKILAVFLMVVTAFAFTACGGSQEAEEAVTHEVTGDVLEADGTTMTIELDDDSTLTFNYEGVDVYDEGAGFEYGQVATVCYEGEPEGTDYSNCTITYIVVQMGEEKKINGKLTALNSDASTLTINTGEKELTFDVSNAERHYKDGIQTGNELVIDYYGRINDTDTTYAHVTAVIDNDLNSAEKHKETVTVKACNETVWTKGAVNIRAGSSTATDVVGTAKKGTKFTRTGILSDGWSRVEYKGKDCYIFSDALTKKDPNKEKPSTTTTTKATTTAEPTSETTTQATSETTTATTAEPTTATTTEETTTTEPAGVESPVKGTITEFTAGSSSTHMTIKTDDGTLYGFDVSHAIINILDGEAVGQKVIVEFEGKIIDGDTSKVNVTKVSSDI